MRLNFFLILMLPLNAWCEDAVTKRKVIYEYKKFEKFDFDEIGVEGDSGAPGDLSIAPSPRKDYDNRLPERKNFLKEIRKSASGIR